MIIDTPLLFSASDYHDGIDPSHLCLSYTVTKSSSRQSRFKGRFYAEPIINLSEYEIKAVFDWLEIYLPTKGTHQARNIKPWLSKQNETFKAFTSCYVGGPIRESGHIGSAFVIRFQEPQPEGLRSLLMATLDKYCSEGAELADLPLTGLELSLDIYPAKQFTVDFKAYATRRMLMTQLLRNHAWVHETHRDYRCRPRFTHATAHREKTLDLFRKPRGGLKAKLEIEALKLKLPSSDVAVLNPSLHRQPYIDATFYYGEKDKRLFYRCMDKTTDQQSPSGARKLPLKQTRSRIELSFIDEVPLDKLGPSSVDLQTYDDISARGLEGFNNLLQFGLPTFSPSVENPAVPDEDELKVFRKSGVAGLAYMQDVMKDVEAAKSGRKSRNRRELLSTGQCMKFSHLNRRVTRAFGRLEHRWAHGRF